MHDVGEYSHAITICVEKDTSLLETYSALVPSRCAGMKPVDRVPRRACLLLRMTETKFWSIYFYKVLHADRV